MDAGTGKQVPAVYFAGNAPDASGRKSGLYGVSVLSVFPEV